MTEPATLEQHLADLLQVGQFDPPAPFAARAVIRDRSVYEQAVDAPAWWAEQASRCLAPPVQHRAR